VFDPKPSLPYVPRKPAAATSMPEPPIVFDPKPSLPYDQLGLIADPFSVIANKKSAFARWLGRQDSPTTTDWPLDQLGYFADRFPLTTSTRPPPDHLEFLKILRHEPPTTNLENS
jgi:hypothetical protein